MRRLVGVLAIGFLLSQVPLSQDVTAATFRGVSIKAGAPCKSSGLSQLYKGDTYKCVLKNRKYIWTLIHRASVVYTNIPSTPTSTPSPTPIPTPTPSELCTSAPDAPVITVTSATSSSGPRFTITASGSGSVPTELHYSYDYFDSGSRTWGNWSNDFVQVATLGTTLLFVSPQPTGKTYVGVTAYALNTCGSSDITWDNPAHTGTALIAAPVIPVLNCTGSGETVGSLPGWSSSTAAQLSAVTLENGSYEAYWCPAAAPSGKGPIIYTITASPGAETCTTTDTSCILTNVPYPFNYYINATNEVGTYAQANAAIQNTGTLYPCITNGTDCNTGPSTMTYPDYGNTPPTDIGDCTFATVADWEQVVLGVNPNATLIGLEFAEAGGTQTTGLTNSQVFSYWQTHGIAGVHLSSYKQYYTDELDVEGGINNPDIGPMIVELHLPINQSIAGYTTAGGGHWALVVGYTPQGPIIVTWGQKLQMTWQQWNLEAVAMWGIKAS